MLVVYFDTTMHCLILHKIKKKNKIHVCILVEYTKNNKTNQMLYRVYQSNQSKTTDYRSEENLSR